MTTWFIVAVTGGILWLWSMYVYIPNNYPTRMRSLGTGWTDGIGHLGAWGGVLIAGQLFTVASPRGFFLFVTIPCAVLPASCSGSSASASDAGRWKSWPARRWAAGCCRRLFPRPGPGRSPPARTGPGAGTPLPTARSCQLISSLNPALRP